MHRSGLWLSVFMGRGMLIKVVITLPVEQSARGTDPPIGVHTCVHQRAMLCTLGTGPCWCQDGNEVCGTVLGRMGARGHIVEERGLSCMSSACTQACRHLERAAGSAQGYGCWYSTLNRGTHPCGEWWQGPIMICGSRGLHMGGLHLLLLPGVTVGTAGLPIRLPVRPCVRGGGEQRQPGSWAGAMLRGAKLGAPSSPGGGTVWEELLGKSQPLRPPTPGAGSGAAAKARTPREYRSGV